MDRALYIRSPVYDWAFFLLPPVLALGIGIALAGTDFATVEVGFRGRQVTLARVAMGVLIHAHLVAVVFRSHANPAIFRLHWIRFTAVPVLLFAAMLASRGVFVVLLVLATFWDVYHSGMQTFGFARIYDRKAGNDPTVGRSLDWGLNHLLYAGPIFAGASMMDHVEDFRYLAAIGSPLATSVPAWMQANHGRIGQILVVGGTAFLVLYLVAYFRLARSGYRISPLKIWLLVSTGVVSVYTWGFNSWGQAWLIMNFFHALQYFGIVWAIEGATIRSLPGARALGAAGGLTLFLGFSLGYGLLAEWNTWYVFAAFTVVVSLMHFWYDGFVWSVRRGQV